MDLDSFGILDPPLSATLASPLPEEAAPAPPTVDGHDNVTASRDAYASHLDFRGAVVLNSELVGQVTTPRVRQQGGRGLQDPEALDRLANKYVPPAGLLGNRPGTAFHALLTRGLIILAAEEESGGQFAAGLVLGRELRDLVPHALVVREELVDSEFHFTPEELLSEHEPAAVLLDMREAASEDIDRVLRGLAEFTDHLAKRRSFLIIIVPQEHARQFDERFPERLHRLQRPSPAEVLAHYLDGLPAVDSLLARAGTHESFSLLWPPKVKELADWIADRVAQGTAPVPALDEWLHKEQGGWSDDLRTVIEEHQAAADAEWIALLLAAAALEGASGDAIVSAADLAMAHSSIPSPELPPLLRPSSVVTLSKLGKQKFVSATRTFEQPGLGTWILKHVWREHHMLRWPMRDWMGELPGVLRDMDSTALEQLADRTAALAGEAGPGLVIDLAVRWVLPGDRTHENSPRWPEPYRRSIAARLLTTAATDPSLGRPIRKKLLDWSKTGRPVLQLLAVDVCAGIGAEFPRVAFTRLKHLVGSAHRGVASSARATVRQLAAEVGPSAFLQYLEEWFYAAPPERLELVAESVSEVLAERGWEVDSDTATSFWQQALLSMPPEILRLAVESWLRTAATAHAEAGVAMVESLVTATGHESRRISQLQYASRFSGSALSAGTPEEDGLSETVKHLWTRLDEVDPVWQ
ncbi:hypothetical protein [Saccharopolyspora cebuensis]|uniref:Uncharacterized protein n=1 Tax=Saccharopolyspora cebuensis TaxID=418759 RepID=A0ABV4CQY6_9PSEU